MTNFQDPSAANISRWRDLGHSVIRAVPTLSYAGHRITLHELRPAWTPAGIGMPPHKHNFCEGIVVVAGDAFETSAARQRLAPGTLFLNPPGVLHSWESPLSDLFRFVVWFTIDTPLDVDNKSPHPHDLALISEIASMLETVRHGAPGWSDCVAARMTLLIAAMLQTAHWQHSGAPPPPGASRRVSEAVDHFLRDNISQPLSLQDIATHCGMSTATLTRHLRQEGHRGAMATLQSFRMELAADLLTNSDIPIRIIAGQSGIPDSSYFNFCFREHFGLTPGRYREKHRLQRPGRDVEPAP